MLKKKSVIIIPARLASTRLPKKLMRSDTGKPLIIHTVENASESIKISNGKILKIIVATDSKEIFNCVNEYSKKNNPLVVAEMTATTHNSGTDRIAEVAKKLPKEIDIVINIQGDEPSLPVSDVMAVAKLLEEDSDAHIATLYREITDYKTFLDSNMVKVVMGKENRCLYFSRAPIPHDRDKVLEDGSPLGFLHFGIYAYRKETLLNFQKLPNSRLEMLEKLEQLRAIEAGLKVVATKTTFCGAGIDTEDDYKKFILDEAN